MASKEIKIALKMAREAIKNKDFKEAIKQCKVVLAEDKNNYNALVFVGVAAEGLEQYDQALKAYRRAAEISPEQSLAWQGLSSLYVKNPGVVGKEEMIGVYEKLMDLHANDKEKKQDVMLKLVALWKNSSLEKALAMYETLMKEVEPGAKRTEILREMVALLQSQQLLTPDQQELLFSGLHELLHTESFNAGDAELEEMTKNFLNLVQKNKPEQLFKECSELVRHFPSLAAPREVKLLVLTDRQTGKGQKGTTIGNKDREKNEEVEEIECLVSTLTEQGKSVDSPELCVAQGYLALNKGSPNLALDYLRKGVSLKPDLFCGHLYLAQCLFKLHEHSACLKTCSDAVALLSKKNRVLTTNTTPAVKQIFLLAARCCYQQGTKYSLAQALEYLEKVTEDAEETTVLRGYILLSLGEADELEACMGRLQTSSSAEVQALKAWIAFKNKEYTAAVNGLEKCVVEDPSNAEYLLKLGCTLWELRSTDPAGRVQEQCFNSLLKAVKLDPNQSQTFLYLGHFYRELKKDQQRARKCYQKSFDLNSSNEEAGAALCDMMAESGEEENVKTLLEDVTANAAAGCAKWAWLRLGLSQVRTGDPTSAITSLQSALRADPSDEHVWECLAEAYLHRGSYTAALKAFGKAAELHPNSTYSLCQIASIKQRLGVLTEAAEEYKLVLSKSSDYVPALKGLGETYLLMAHRHLDQCLTGLALDSCQQAIACLTRAATQRPDLSCLWKLLGDSCLLLHGIDSNTFRICVPKRLCQSASADDQDVISIGKQEMLEIATKCYGKALKILPESAPLWHDMGTSFYYQCCRLKSNSETKLLIEKSMHVLKKAITLEPSTAAHWTTLGVVAASQHAKNYALAQHCFIKSIQLESNNAVAWTNLGTLYLQNDNIKLAHEAFKVAQNQDPEYIASWIGQGLIAEIVAHEDAMDLFRHTTDIGIHMESCIGYGHWVITTLLDVSKQDTPAFQYCIKQMAAIPVAVMALSRFTRVNETDPWAHNMLALLLEHQGLVVLAEQALHRAVQLLEEPETADSEKAIKVKLNLARLLSKNKKYDEAITIFRACERSATFADLCQLGLSFYQAGRLTDSLTVYQHALSMTTSNKDEADVYTALGMVAFKCGDLERAKSSLFNGFQICSSSARGLLALCALGLVQRDVDLVEATLTELSALVQGGPSLADLAALRAAFKVGQGHPDQALAGVQQLLQHASNVPGLWLVAARVALLHLKDGALAMTCAEEAISRGSPNDQRALQCLTLAQLQLGKHSVRTARDNAVSAAQKAFHVNPVNISNICLLVSTVHAKAVIYHVTRGETSLFDFELQLLDRAMTSPDVTPAQMSWCLKQKSIAQIIARDVSGASETLKKMSHSFPEEELYSSVLDCVVKNKQGELESLVLRSGSDLFFWQILLARLVNEQRYSEAGALLREAMQKARGESDSQVKQVCLVSIAWLAAHQLLEKDAKKQHYVDEESLHAEFEEAVQTVAQVSNQPYTAMQLLQALVHVTDNQRKAKHHFVNILKPEAGQQSSSLAIDVSLARRGVIFFLHTTRKDPDLLQELLLEAETTGDRDAINYYEKLLRRS